MVACMSMPCGLSTSFVPRHRFRSQMQIGDHVSVKPEVGMVMVGVERYAATVLGAKKSQSL